MRQCLFVLAALSAVAACAHATPLTPTITGHDINFGAQFRYLTQGSGADLLTTQGATGGEIANSGEATAYWPSWPSTAGVKPIWWNLGIVGAPSFAFGGDVQLAVVFNGHDETGSPLSVSLTGTGANAGADAADLQVFGYINANSEPTPEQPNVLLWAIDFNETGTPAVPGVVSLYGYANTQSYVLEGVGKVVGGALATANDLVGKTGVIRGNVDFSPNFAVPNASVGFPAGYNPMVAPAQDVEGIGSYSGETGPGYAVPEPWTVGFLAIGSLLIGRRRHV